MAALTVFYWVEKTVAVRAGRMAGKKGTNSVLLWGRTKDGWMVLRKGVQLGAPKAYQMVAQMVESSVFPKVDSLVLSMAAKWGDRLAELTVGWKDAKRDDSMVDWMGREKAVQKVVPLENDHCLAYLKGEMKAARKAGSMVAYLADLTGDWKAAPRADRMAGLMVDLRAAKMDNWKAAKTGVPLVGWTVAWKAGQLAALWVD